MHQLRRISWIMTLLGACITLAALLFRLDQVWMLIGLLLAWAGIVKIVVTVIWYRVAHMGTDDHLPTPSP